MDFNEYMREVRINPSINLELDKKLKQVSYIEAMSCEWFYINTAYLYHMFDSNKDWQPFSQKYNDYTKWTPKMYKTIIENLDEHFLGSNPLRPATKFFIKNS